MKILFEHGNKYHTVLNTNAEQCDEANAGRDTEIGIGDVQCHDAADQRERYIQQHKSRVQGVTKADEQQNKNEYQNNRYHLSQLRLCPYLVLKFSCPFDVKALV